MATRYCGIGGSDANSGLTWALRKLTLNGVEDTPVVAGDTIYVGPGVYRETLTCDISGTAGNPITYIADVAGQNTDGIGGVVRITGSDNDQTPTRTNCITGTTKNYRTWRGFVFEGTTSNGVRNTDGTNWIIEDCSFIGNDSGGLSIDGATATSCTVRRCLFFGNRHDSIAFSHSATVSNSANLVENCMVFGGLYNRAISSTRVGGITVKNCYIMLATRAVQVITALAGGQTVTVNNCIIANCGNAVEATVAGELVENYNAFSSNDTIRTNVNTGANSVTYLSLPMPPMQVSGIRYPFQLGALSPWSPVRAIAGTGEASDDMLGVTRPATSAKKSWGPVQFVPMLRETTTVRTGAASLRLSDAGRHQMFVPVTAVSTVFSVYVQWEADYAGTKPQLVIKQPGQSDTTVTATGSSGSWEQLTTTITPAALPPYVIVELVSNNTAASTNFDVFFDDLTIS